MRLPSDRSPMPLNQRTPGAWVALAIAVVVTLALWALANRQLEGEARARFLSESHRLGADLRSRLESPILAMESCLGLFDSEDRITPVQWKAFIRRFEPRKRFPGMRNIGFAHAVREREITEFEAQASRTMGLPYTVRVDRTGDPETLHLALLFMEPELPTFRTELAGTDFLVEPRRKDAVLSAVDRAALAVTAPLTLIGQDPEAYRSHPGLVFYFPVYLKGLGPGRPADPRAALRGVVYASLFADEFLASAFANSRDIRVRVEDAEASWEGRPLYESALPSAVGQKARGWRFEREERLQVGQRTWVIRYSTLPGFAASLRDWIPAMILVTGLSLGAILFLFIRAQLLGRARAESLAEALRDSEGRFRSLIDASASIIVIYSEVVEFVNDYACKLLKLEREQVLGSSLWSHVHPEDQAMVQERIRGLEMPARCQFRLVGGDGAVHWVDFTAGRVLWEGRYLGIATAFDVTEQVVAVEERLRMERKLMEGQRLESLGRLAGGVAHDFNNLLCAILGNAEVAETGLPDDAPARKSLTALKASVHRATALSHQMLAVSGHGTVLVESLDLNAQIRQVNQLLEVSAAKQAVLEFDLADVLPPILADAGQLDQLLVTLVTNAAEAMEGGGHIRLRTFLRRLEPKELAQMVLGRDLAAGEFVALEVKDDGGGMDAATMARIFDPFFSTKFTGRGLGLAALRGIVAGHRGAIEVASEPGRGSCFTIHFPAAGAAPAPAPPPAERPEGPQHLLLVEDEADLREVTLEVLDQAGYAVVAAVNGADAVERFREDPARFDLVVLDLLMPVMDGEACLKALRALRPDLKILLTSGYGGKEVNERFSEGQLSGFVQKPYRMKDLLRAIEDTLRS